MALRVRELSWALEFIGKGAEEGVGQGVASESELKMQGFNGDFRKYVR
jgi:hypothetical protein